MGLLGHPSNCRGVVASEYAEQRILLPSDVPVEGRGWGATVTDMALPGHKWKRWGHPPVPADVPNAPRGYFVEAVKA